MPILAQEYQPAQLSAEETAKVVGETVAVLGRTLAASSRVEGYAWLAVGSAGPLYQSGQMRFSTQDSQGGRAVQSSYNLAFEGFGAAVHCERDTYNIGQRGTTEEALVAVGGGQALQKLIRKDGEVRTEAATPDTVAAMARATGSLVRRHQMPQPQLDTLVAQGGLHPERIVPLVGSILDVIGLKLATPEDDSVSAWISTHLNSGGRVLHTRTGAPHNVEFTMDRQTGDRAKFKFTFTSADGGLRIAQARCVSKVMQPNGNTVENVVLQDGSRLWRVRMASRVGMHATVAREPITNDRTILHMARSAVLAQDTPELAI